MGVQIVGVELDRSYLAGAGSTHHLNLFIESVSASGGQHDRAGRCQSGRQLDTDLTAATENQDDAGFPGTRVGCFGCVFHGCDYSLR